MSEGRKRRRKSKLEVRPDDCEYEVVSERNDEIPLQKIPKLRFVHPIYPLFDHDYCKRGYQGYASPFYPSETKKSIRNSTIIAVQQTQGPSGSLKLAVQVEQFDDNGQEMSLYPKNKKSLTEKKMEPKTADPKKPAIKMCKYNPEVLYKVSGEIASTSSNPVDRVLDIELRNLWGSVLNTPEKVDEHESALQSVLESWQGWLNHSRLFRECPLFYQCHICELAWWRLEPFRVHIKKHDMKTLKISFKENVHECMIVASNYFVSNMMFFNIDEDCWKCGKDLEFHKNSSRYMCGRCNKYLYTCTAFSEHESTCLYSNVSNFNVGEGRQCKICNKYMDSLKHLLKHMEASHSVRSDIPVPVSYKICTHCRSKYFIYSNHNCTRSPKNSGCDYCCRKFATKPLAMSHMLSQYNRAAECQVCEQRIQARCQEMEHLLNHSSNYELVYKCTLCMNQYLLFIDEESVRLHRKVWHHQKKSDKRRAFYEKMLVPKLCLQEGSMEEVYPEPSALKSARKNSDEKDFCIGNISADQSQLSAFTDAHSDQSQLRVTTNISESQSRLSVLSANVDVTVDEVDIKKEPIEYSENGEIDYEVMLHKMFNQSQESPTKESKTRKDQTKMPADLKTPIKDPTTPVEKTEFVFENVKIKTEPVDDIDIIENPVEAVKIKTEPADDSNEYREYQSQNIMYMELKNDSENQNQKQEKEQEVEMNQTQALEMKCVTKKENIIVNQKRSHAKKRVKSKNNKRRLAKNKNQVHKANNQKNQKQEQNIVETLTVKVEPDINMDDILTENIVIKNEMDDEDQNRDDISTDSIPFDQLITDLNMSKNDMMSKDLNPDEMTFDIINPSGLYRKKKVYACHKCGYTAQHKQYRIHISSNCAVSPGINGSYPCSKCGLTFVMFRNYVLHFDTHGYQVMACPKCGIVFETLLKLLSHVQKHIKNNFVGLHVLHKGGEESSKSKKLVKCQECREVVVQDVSFTHWESHLALIMKPPNPVPLPIANVKEEVPELTVDCERVTMNNKTLEPAALKQAIDNLQSESLVEKECVICYRAFTRRYDLKRHIVEHLLMDAHMNKYKNKCFRCQICLEGFEHQEKYKFHMREHGCMPIFKCELCNKTFSDSSNFAKHKKTHNVRVLVCDLCNKKFHSRSALEKHIVDHRNLPKTKCAYCERTFISKQFYKKHKYQMHVKNKYKCVLCDLSFNTLQHKWDHNWEVHKERKQNADCPICLKSFRKFQDVRVHARAEHRADVHPMRKGRDSDLQYYKVKELKTGKITEKR